MEIERKWLVSVDSIPYELDKLDSHLIEQIYISSNPTIRARRINNGEKHILTIKTRNEGVDPSLARNEYEMPLSAEEYANLVPLCYGSRIVKRRYTVLESDGLLREIDIFHGQLEGLAFLEIEFPDTETALAFPSPFWVMSDVTRDKRYKNSYLAIHGMPQP